MGNYILQVLTGSYLINNRYKMKKEELLEKICTLVETDFCADMELRTMPNDGKYPEITQEEAREMAKLLASVYHYAHQIHCGAHK